MDHRPPDVAETTGCDERQEPPFEVVYHSTAGFTVTCGNLITMNNNFIFMALYIAQVSHYRVL